MKLNEKIIYYRKKNGLSQEDLATKINVSRQAISKWETGESTPELNKITLLAKIFEISCDQLLNDDEARENTNSEKNYPVWVDRLPNNITRMLKKFGWLYGVGIMASGVFIIIFSYVGKTMFKSIIFGNSTFGDPFFSSFNQNAFNTSNIFFNFIFGIGIIFTIIGLVIAIVLKIWGQKTLNN